MPKKVNKSISKPLVPETTGERALVQAVLRASREAKAKLKAARDPKASLDAYTSIFKETDAIAQQVVSDAEGEASDEEDDTVERDGVTYRAAGTFEKTYQSTRGQLRIRRKLYRSKRNGPTRCFFEERRGVMHGIYTQDLGRVVVGGVAEVPADKAKRLVEQITHHPISSSTMKRTARDVGLSLHKNDEKFCAVVVKGTAVPASTAALVISVDALSYPLRQEGYKQATVATLSILDGDGNRLQTIRFGEIPESGKRRIMRRIKREAQSILKRRPELKTEIVIDGASDLREHMLKIFPFARHVTDFFHVAGYVAAALRVLPFETDCLRTKQRELLCHRLKHDDGGADEVIEYLKDSLAFVCPQMSAPDREIVQRSINYLEKQRPYLDYADAASDNVDIGSGPVEAAAKTIVAARLKGSGMQWSRRGSRAIIQLRGLAQSGRLDDALSFHANFSAGLAA